jgi:MFS family permease
MTIFCSTRTRDTMKKISSNNDINGGGDGIPAKEPKPFEKLYPQKLVLIVLVSVLLSFFSASESAFFAFSATYFQYIPLKLSAGRAAELVSMMALTFTISRGLAVLIAMRLKPHYIIAIFLSILMISLIILFFSTDSLWLLWLGIMTMSFGFSPIYASIFSLMGRYVEFTYRINTIMMLSANSLNLVLPYILGKYIERNPNVFLISLIFLITFSAIFFAFIMYFIVKFKKTTLHKQNGYRILEQ